MQHACRVMAEVDCIKLLFRRNIGSSKNSKKVNVDDLIETLLKLTHIRLDREGLCTVPNLDFLPLITNLYLQENNISSIENLENLNSIKFLTLSKNNITQIRGLKTLSQLGFLDLSDNFIEDFNVKELPISLVILNLEGNPCAKYQGYHDNIVSNLPNLKSLDNTEIEQNLSDDEEESENEDSITKNEPSVFSNIHHELEEKERELMQNLNSDIGEALQQFSSALHENKIKMEHKFANLNFEHDVVRVEEEVSALGLEFNKSCLLNEDRREIKKLDTNSVKCLKSPSSKYRPKSGGQMTVVDGKSVPKKEEKVYTRTRTHIRIPGARPFQL